MPEALIAGVLMLGVGVVAPMALGHHRRWFVALAAVAASLVVARGPGAAALAAIWAMVAACALFEAVRAYPRPTTRSAAVAEVAAPAYACTAAVAFCFSRAGVAMFGIGEPIVELTAVHFTYAGVGAVTLAGVASRTHHIARAAAVALTVVAPPVVALGFLLAHPVPQIGGAVLMTAGVWVTAVLQLSEVRSTRGPARVLLLVSGLAPWAPMVLAVAWAASLYADLPALGIPDMARTHGTINAVFVLAGLAARDIQGLLRRGSPIAAVGAGRLGTAI